MYYIVIAVLIFLAMVCGFYLSLSMDKYLEHHNLED